MRYIGGKSKILSNILDLVELRTERVETVMDLFSGSGVVSECLKLNGYEVYSNDLLYFSYILNRGYLSIGQELKFNGLSVIDPIDYLNNLKLEDSGFKIDDCYIYKNYSKNDDCERMYFQPKNAIKIDIIRMKIREWNDSGLLSEDEYYYLIQCLLSAVPYISNIAGVYGAYLKFWDKRSFGDLKLIKKDIIITGKPFVAYNEDSNDLVKRISCDLAYLDPPYNARQYLPNYHILETIAKYDNPVIKGVTGMRDYIDSKSDFCQKRLAEDSLDDLIKNTQARYVIMSYSTDGLIPMSRLIEIMSKYSKFGNCEIYEFDYARYKNKKALVNNNLKEQLYFIEKDL